MLADSWQQAEYEHKHDNTLTKQESDTSLITVPLDTVSTKKPAIDRDGNMYLTGLSYSVSDGESAFFVAHFDDKGNPILEIRIKGIGTKVDNKSIKTLPDGTVVTVGSLTSQLGKSVLIGFNPSSLNIVFADVLEKGDEPVVVNDMVVDDENNIFLVGGLGSEILVAKRDVTGAMSSIRFETGQAVACTLKDGELIVIGNKPRTGNVGSSATTGRGTVGFTANLTLQLALNKFTVQGPLNPNPSIFQSQYRHYVYPHDIVVGNDGIVTNVGRTGFSHFSFSPFISNGIWQQQWTRVAGSSYINGHPYGIVVNSDDFCVVLTVRLKAILACIDQATGQSLQLTQFAADANSLLGDSAYGVTPTAGWATCRY